MADELACKTRFEYYDYDTSLGYLLKYRGLATPGAATSAAAWRICKYTCDVNGLVTQIDFADGVSTFNKIWDNRDSYSYS